MLRAIREKLTPAIVPMATVQDLGTRAADVTPGLGADAVDVLADHDDALLAEFVEAGVSQRRLRDALAAQSRQALVHPVFFGSAITGAGVDSLIAGLTELLPATEGPGDGPVSGSVFKVERGAAGEKIAYVRLFAGTVRVRDRLQLPGGRAGKVTAISVFDRGSDAPRGSVTAGRIGRLWGLADVRVGDVIGSASAPPVQFAPPTLETVVVPASPGARSALHVALTQLAEQDPLINLRQDEIRREISVSLYGEVQKEVIAATLADDYGIDVTFRETTTICIERPTGTGAAFELIGTDSNPFLATVGLRVEPAPVGSGVRFRLGVELGSMPPAFMKAVEETVAATLSQGVHGWQVVDCTVTLTHSGYWARQSHAHGSFDASMSSTAGDFRSLTPLVLTSALQRAGTAVYEPIHRFSLEAPADALSALLRALAGLRAVARTTAIRDPSCLLEGEIPAAMVHELRQQLPALTRGEGVLDCEFDDYRQVRGPAPTRPRTDHDPRNRKEYLLHVQRRV